MPRIPILIAELPPLLRDILIDSIADRSDVAVVGVVEPGGPIAPAIDRTGATVLVVAAGASTRAARAELLGRGRAAPSILAITRDGYAAVAEVALGELSPDCLVEALCRLAEVRGLLGGST